VLEEKAEPPARSRGGGIFLSVDLFPKICPDGRILGLIGQKPKFFGQDGKLIEPAKGDIVVSSCDTPHVVKFDGRFGYVDAAMRPMIPARFESASPFRDGLATVKIDGQYGLIREDGSWALDPAFDAAQSLQDGLALVKVGEHASLIDIATGRLITRTEFDEVCSLGRGLVGVMAGGRMGAIDQKGRWLIEPQYEPFRLNYVDFTSVRSGGKWGFLDWAGNAIETKFEEVSRFVRGVAWVKSDGEWCPIDRRGNKVPTLPCQNVAPRYIEQPRPDDVIACRIWR
jgi:hypothetical protein